MLYDRPYMRDRTPQPHVDYFWWAFWLLIGAFVAQNFLGVWVGLGDGIYRWLALSPVAMEQGKVWTIFTYALLHHSLGHFFFNALMFFFIGKWVSRQIEPKIFLRLLLASAFLGGFVWVLLHAVFRGFEANLVGFSGVIGGIFATGAFMNRDLRIGLLLLPFTFRAINLFWVFLGLDAAGFLFIELPLMLGMSPVLRPQFTAFSAHLGGALAGYLFYRYLQRPDPIFKSATKSVSIEPPQWMRKKKAASPGKFKVNTSDRRDLRKEVDRILDKINREGFGALNDEEKRVLDEAGEILKK